VITQRGERGPKTPLLSRILIDKLLCKMELRHLRYFTAVAKHLNYSEASRRIHVAQPATSQTIIDLEEELEVRFSFAIVARFGSRSPEKPSGAKHSTCCAGNRRRFA
jgi:Bacterial regulatory helix-turn-helix protein, lysR family